MRQHRSVPLPAQHAFQQHFDRAVSRVHVRLRCPLVVDEMEQVAHYFPQRSLRRALAQIGREQNYLADVGLDRRSAVMLQLHVL